MKDKQLLKSVKNIVAVSSGKGLVGKSTVAANLAVSPAQMGYKIGLLDADISVPSIPKMFGIDDSESISCLTIKDARKIIVLNNKKNNH